MTLCHVNNDATVNNKSLMIFYYCLAQGFNYPTPELAQMIKEETFADVITAAAKQLGFEVASAVEQLKNSICGFQSEDQLLSELQSEYTYLFINAPGHLPVPPYASVHLSKDQLCGLKIHEVLEFYRAAGVGVPSSFSDPPDHLAVELEYMVYLLQNNLLELRERFLKEHFLLWVPSFSVKVQEAAQREFYRQLAVLADQICQWEKVRM